jgi:hypothetical protein
MTSIIFSVSIDIVSVTVIYSHIVRCWHAVYEAAWQEPCAAGMALITTCWQSIISLASIIPHDVDIGNVVVT